MDFIEPMRLTLDLYHNQVVDPRLVAIAFQQLKDDNPDAELEVTTIGKKGKHRDKLLVRAETAPQADHSTLNSEYFYNLDYLKSLPREALEALLVDKERMNQRFIAMIEVRQKSPDTAININGYQGGKIVTGDRNIGKIGRDYHEDNRGENSGDVIENVGRDKINYGTQQKQNLSEAAAEIQALLEQLAKTYPTETLSQQAVVAETAIAEIERNPTFKERVIAAIKAMGVEAFMEAIDHPVANVLRAGVEKWKEPGE